MKSVPNRRRLSIESLEARRLLAPIDVTNTDNAGTGSLRWAIEQANLQSQPDEIQFDSLGAGQHVIALNAPLPKIVSPVTISGNTASGYSGTPLVRIQPSGSFGSSGQGLLVGNGPLGGGGTSTGAAIVRALSITGFPQGGIRVEANADLQLYNSYIGLDLNGAAAGNSGNGIHYTGTNGDSLNRIEGNVISSNAGHGILMFDARELDIVNNKIGTNVAGTADFGNGQDGIKVQNAPSGMTTEVDITDNVISGNAMKGIELVNVVGTNTILRNKIGTNAAGNAAIPNTEKGISIFTNTTISSLTTEVTDNLISGNGSAGIELTGSDVRSTLITTNKIGVGADGTTPLANAGDGVLIINGARENYVAQNTIRSNSGAGIRVAAAGGTSTAGGVDNRFKENSISGNGGLGIDIGPSGLNAPNDPGDGDSGPNDLQNYPEILAAERNIVGNYTAVRVRLESSAIVQPFVCKVSLG